MPFIPAVRPGPDTTSEAWCFAFVQGRLLLPADESAAFAPQPIDLLHALSSTRHYLGRLDDVDCWAVSAAQVPAGWRDVPLRGAMMQFEAPMMGVAARAAQVLEWDRAHRFCGVCGTPTELHPDDRARVCPSCKHTAYPRISPAMMALVWRGREVLLARGPQFNPGIYSALAGFVEPGESIEECIGREVAEEVGVAVKNLRYYGSQNWPFPHSLMIAFTAEWDGGEIVPQPGEIEDAQWFDIDALPGIPPRFSISGHLIRDTVEQLRAGRQPSSS